MKIIVLRLTFASMLIHEYLQLSEKDANLMP